MDWLRQSTAATVKMGPFVDETDGKTAETGLTISQADIRVSKNGGAFAQSNNAAGATHDEGGEYGVPLDTTDTNTLGRLKVRIHESGALPVWKEFMVVPAMVYDAMILGSDRFDVNVTHVADTSQTAGDIIADTNDIQAKLGTPSDLGSGATVAGNLVDIEGQTDDIGVAGAGLTVLATAAELAKVPKSDGTVSWNATAAAQLQSEANDALVAFFTSAATLAGLVWTNGTRTLTAIDEDSTTLDLDATIRAAIGLTAANLETLLTSTGIALTASERNSIAAALLDLTDGVETGVTPRQALRAIAAVIVAIISGAGTGTEVFKGIGQASGGTTRVTVTVDSSGNRSAITLNL